MLVLIAAGCAAWLAVVGGAALVWRRVESRDLRRRLALAAAAFSGAPAGAGDDAGAESVFRTQRRASALRRLLWDRIETRYPLLDAPAATAKALLAGLAGAAVFHVALIVLKVPGGGLALAASAAAGALTARYALGQLHARSVTAFIRDFPEVVDQIVRLSGTGVPPLEAVGAVAEDAPGSVKPVLLEIREALTAGLDSSVALRTVAERVRIPEFTMFAATIRLQRRSGGGISNAFSNLSETLRERRKTALKAHSSTAQTRLTLLLLALMPVAVLVGQSVLAPQSVDALLNTDRGATLMRWGVALIVAGLLIARNIARRAGD